MSHDSKIHRTKESIYCRKGSVAVQGGKRNILFSNFTLRTVQQPINDLCKSSPREKSSDRTTSQKPERYTLEDLGTSTTPSDPREGNKTLPESLGVDEIRDKQKL